MNSGQQPIECMQACQCARACEGASCNAASGSYNMTNDCFSFLGPCLPLLFFVASGHAKLTPRLPFFVASGKAVRTTFNPLLVGTYLAAFALHTTLNLTAMRAHLQV
ncbi:unnamed protein product [Polarella glacialis]|uniref:Uncharacterized protein n=1 Tax=Polarella glacialis TaxID=89957 RepID=A0A813LH60_POLGL|nr:unnamed protein product [Polarella glacialis]